MGQLRAVVQVPAAEEMVLAVPRQRGQQGQQEQQVRALLEVRQRALGMRERQKNRLPVANSWRAVA